MLHFTTPIVPAMSGLARRMRLRSPSSLKCFPIEA